MVSFSVTWSLKSQTAWHKYDRHACTLVRGSWVHGLLCFPPTIPICIVIKEKYQFGPLGGISENPECKYTVFYILVRIKRLTIFVCTIKGYHFWYCRRTKIFLYRLQIPKIVKLSLIIANGICAFLTLVSAGMLSAGLSSWCSQLMALKDHGLSIQSWVAHSSVWRLS